MSEASASRTPAITLSQSPTFGWRNKRAVGYHGLSSRSSSQRKSGENGRRIHRLRHGARQMGDRGIDADHEIEMRDDAGGIGEVLKLRPEMHDVGVSRHQGGIAVAQLRMQADVTDARIA